MLTTSEAGQLDPNSENTEYLARLAGEDRNVGFTQLYTRIAPSLHAWAALKIRPHRLNQLEPEDIVQDVWLRAMEKFCTP